MLGDARRNSKRHPMEVRTKQVQDAPRGSLLWTRPHLPFHTRHVPFRAVLRLQRPMNGSPNESPREEVVFDGSLVPAKSSVPHSAPGESVECFARNESFDMF